LERQGIRQEKEHWHVVIVEAKRNTLLAFYFWSRDSRAQPFGVTVVPPTQRDSFNPKAANCEFLRNNLCRNDLQQFTVHIAKTRPNRANHGAGGKGQNAGNAGKTAAINAANTPQPRFEFSQPRHPGISQSGAW
jgi:hypothetical protein